MRNTKKEKKQDKKAKQTLNKHRLIEHRVIFACAFGVCVCVCVMSYENKQQAIAVDDAAGSVRGAAADESSKNNFNLIFSFHLLRVYATNCHRITLRQQTANTNRNVQIKSDNNPVAGAISFRIWFLFYVLAFVIFRDNCKTFTDAVAAPQTAFRFFTQKKRSKNTHSTTKTIQFPSACNLHS